MQGDDLVGGVEVHFSAAAGGLGEALKVMLVLAVVAAMSFACWQWWEAHKLRAQLRAKDDEIRLRRDNEFVLECEVDQLRRRARDLTRRLSAAHLENLSSMTAGREPPETAGREPPELCDKIVQAPCTYSSVRKVKDPKFEFLRKGEDGAWSE